MIKSLFIFFLFLSPLIVPGQDRPVLSTKTIDSLHQTIREYEERNIGDTMPDYASFRYRSIGDCYLELNDSTQALAYYRLALTTGEFDYGMMKRRSLGELGACFQKKGQYDSILYYYNIIERSKVRRVGCGNTVRYVMPEYKYWLMVGLNGVGMIDSAVKVFMPYAFNEWTNNDGSEISTAHLFENDYHCKMAHFIGILEKKYSSSRIYEDVLKLPDSNNFKVLKNEKDGSCYYEFGFRLVLGDHSHFLYGWVENCPAYESKKEDSNDTYSDVLSAELKKSFIYRYYTERTFL